jgi:hypothetical protein
MHERFFCLERTAPSKVIGVCMQRQNGENGLHFDQRFIWPGQNTEEFPASEVPRVLQVVPSSVQTVGMVVMIIFLLFSAFLHYLLYVQRDHEVIKASSQPFCQLIVMGRYRWMACLYVCCVQPAHECFCFLLCGLGFCSNFVYVACGLSSLSFEIHCRIMPTLVAVAFSIIFGSLLTKTYVRPLSSSSSHSLLLVGLR